MTPVREALEALRHADIDLSMLLSEIANDEMRASVRKTLDMIDRARKALSAAPGEPCARIVVTPTRAIVTENSLPHGEHWVYTTPQPAAGWDEAIEVCIRELQYCRDHGHEPDITTIKKLTALRREAPAPADLSYVSQLIAENNELKNQLTARPDTAEARLREADRREIVARTLKQNIRLSWITENDALVSVKIKDSNIELCADAILAALDGGRDA